MKVLSRRLPHTACDLVPLVFLLLLLWFFMHENPAERIRTLASNKKVLRVGIHRKPVAMLTLIENQNSSNQVISSWICLVHPLALPAQVTTWCIAAFASHNRPDQRSIRMAASPAENCTTARWSMLPTWRWWWFKILLPLISWSSTRWKTFLQPNAERYRSFAKH